MKREIGAGQIETMRRGGEAALVAGLGRLFHTWRRDAAAPGDTGTAALGAFVLRLLAIKFVQATGRLGGDRAFLARFWAAYQASGARDCFAGAWLPALWAACDRRTHGSAPTGVEWPPDIAQRLQAAPDLRGSLFGPNDPDIPPPPLPDTQMADILAFLDTYTLTACEDSADDGALGSAMLGTLYECLLGAEQAGARTRAGVFYTARPEIDLMCRLAVVDSLSEQVGAAAHPALYTLLFPDAAQEDERAQAAATLGPAIGDWLATARVLDPTCGAGAFLVGMQAVRTELAARVGAPLPPAEGRVHGCDVQERAVQIARLRLWLQAAAARPADAPLPAPQTYAVEVGDSLDGVPFAALDGFDIMIGNPPYVRQEALGPAARKARLAQAVYRRFPTFFGYDAAWDRAARPLTARSDLYLYFYFLGYGRLAPGGTLCFLTSNAWLDTGYGAPLRAFLAAASQVRLVIEHTAQRSFAADVNTVITLVHASPPGPDARTRFVRCRVPFDQLTRAAVWTAVENATSPQVTPDWEVRPVPQTQLAAPDAPAAGGGWGGTYLRLPDILQTVLARAGAKIAPLGRLARVETGIYTGINEFFYLDAARVAAFGIEPEFLRLVIRSPRVVPGVRIDAARLDCWLFVCREDEATLKEQGATGALAYIAWGVQQRTTARQKVQAGIPWPQVPSVAGRRPGWWALAPPPPAQIFLLYGVGARHGQRYSPVPLISDRRLHMVYYAQPASVQETLVAGLNTILGVLCVELQGRANLGQGALDLATMDARHLPVLDPAVLAPAAQEALRAGLHTIWDAPLPEVPDPSYRAHLAPLNDALAVALGLTPGEMDALFAATLDLVTARLRKADDGRWTTDDGRRLNNRVAQSVNECEKSLSC